MTTYDLVQRSEEVLETAKRINGELTQQHGATAPCSCEREKKLGQAREARCCIIRTSENVTLCASYSERVDISRAGLS